MKPRHFFVILFALSIGCSSNLTFGQTIEQQLNKSRPDCYTMFTNAMNILPEMYRESAFDSLGKALDIWERACNDLPVTITRILFDIEESKFTFDRDMDIAAFEYLKDYARAFPSEDDMKNVSSFNEPQKMFYRFSAGWAKLLLRSKNLDENEKFICRVLSGDIRIPEKEIKQNPDTYPEFIVLLEKNFENERKQIRSDLTLGTGVWIPTNNLTILGMHPSFTFQVGGRTVHHQIDFTLQIRYLHTPEPYAIKRDEEMDSTDYYVGYYAGADYVYYFVSKKRYDIGVGGGIGYDGFDFAPQPYDYYYYDPYYTSHLNVGSFNANAGLRFNYYFSHSFYVGLIGKYNGIHYSTHGGTNLSGDAVTIDLVFGFNGKGDKSKGYRY
jgi:hypothetical protein